MPTLVQQHRSSWGPNEVQLVEIYVPLLLVSKRRQTLQQQEFMLCEALMLWRAAYNHGGRGQGSVLSCPTDTPQGSVRDISVATAQRR